MWIYVNTEIIISKMEDKNKMKTGKKKHPNLKEESKIETLYKQKTQNKIAEINPSY